MTAGALNDQCTGYLCQLCQAKESTHLGTYTWIVSGNTTTLASAAAHSETKTVYPYSARVLIIKKP
jgi:hypothetical protein